MNPLYVGLFFAVFAVVMAAVSGVLKKKRAGSEKYQKIIEDFQQEVNGVLDADEAVEAICGYYPCAAVTNKRLLIGTKKGIEPVQFSEIKSLKGMNFSGNKTSDPDQMLAFQIKAAKKYTLGNHSEGFKQVVEYLMQRAGR